MSLASVQNGHKMDIAIVLTDIKQSRLKAA